MYIISGKFYVFALLWNINNNFEMYANISLVPFIHKRKHIF